MRLEEDNADADANDESRSRSAWHGARGMERATRLPVVFLRICVPFDNTYLIYYKHVISKLTKITKLTLTFAQNCLKKPGTLFLSLPAQCRQVILPE
jgi:hypothetical protein